MELMLAETVAMGAGALTARGGGGGGAIAPALPALPLPLLAGQSLSSETARRSCAGRTGNAAALARPRSPPPL